MKRLTSVVLAALLSVPNGSLLAAANPGAVEGKVTLGERPLSGAQIALVDVKSGAVVRVTTDSAGHFKAAVPAGQYVVTTENGLGLSVAKGPTILSVQPGVASHADLELVAVATAASHGSAPDTPPAAPGASQATIKHDPIGCFIAGQFPLVDAKIEPASSVARARVYFKAAKFADYYYVEMTPAELEGFIAKLPRPKLEASPITYYILATTTEFGEAQTPEYDAIVVEDEKDCPGKRVAPIGPPGEVTVFSSSTGLAAGLPAGFAAGAGLLSGGILVGVIVLGAATAGVVGAVVIGGDTTTTTVTTSTTTTTTPTSSTTTTLPTTTTTIPASPFR